MSADWPVILDGLSSEHNAPVAEASMNPFPIGEIIEHWEWRGAFLVVDNDTSIRITDTVNRGYILLCLHRGDIVELPCWTVENDYVVRM